MSVNTKEHTNLTEEKLQEIAKKIGAELVVGDALLLYGDLGAGKTTFCRALIQSLCGEDTTVPSPTYTVVQTYDTPKGTLHHYDLYRLPEEDAEDDIIELGWDDSLNDAITLVEWPERLGTLKSGQEIVLKITIEDEKNRRININKNG